MPQHAQVNEPDEPRQAVLPVPTSIEPGRDAVLPREVLDGTQERAGSERAAGIALVKANAMLAGVLPWVIHGSKYAGNATSASRVRAGPRVAPGVTRWPGESENEHVGGARSRDLTAVRPAGRLGRPTWRRGRPFVGQCTRWA